MFNTIIGIESLQPALEARSPEQEKKRKEFLESRIRRRWNFNKNSSSVAREQLVKYQTGFGKLKKRIEGKTLDKTMFATLVINTRAIEASLMLAGLSEIEKLANVFAKIASMPPSTEQANLPHFKATMLEALKQNAPAYSYSGYKVYASFVANKSLMKTGETTTALGYEPDFITIVEKALHTTNQLITNMVEHEALIHKLGAEIVIKMMGPRANDYCHARRGYELVCTLYTSILTLAWPQQMAMALTIADKIADCYR